MDFDGAVVLVTGGANGIGEAIGSRFLKEGSEVLVFDIEEPSYDARYFDVDVRREGEIEEAFNEIDRLDVLVNNAGVYEQVSVENTSSEALDRVIDTNLKGYYLVSKHALSLLQESGGCIVNVSSALGEVPEPSSPAYCASKAGINMLTKCMAQGYRESGVRVNAVLPGPIDTEMLRDAFDTDEEMEEYASMNPMGEVGEPDDVAEAVMYLASERAEFVNGATWEVDGGEASSSLYS